MGRWAQAVARTDGLLALRRPRFQQAAVAAGGSFLLQTPVSLLVVNLITLPMNSWTAAAHLDCSGLLVAPAVGAQISLGSLHEAFRSLLGLEIRVCLARIFDNNKSLLWAGRFPAFWK